MILYTFISVRLLSLPKENRADARSRNCLPTNLKERQKLARRSGVQDLCLDNALLPTEGFH